jgi:hypothetical protein
MGISYTISIYKKKKSASQIEGGYTLYIYNEKNEEEGNKIIYCSTCFSPDARLYSRGSS